MSMKKMMRGVFYLLLLSPLSLEAATRYVATTGTDTGDCTVMESPCQTLTYTIDQAASSDEIEIAAGTYEGQTEIFFKDITFRGVGVGQTILSGGGTTNPVYAYSSNVVLSDMSIVNGSANYGGCIYSYSSYYGYSNLTLNNVQLENCVATDATDGGAIFFYNYTGGALTVNNSTIINNSASSGAAVYTPYADAEFNNVTIAGNTGTTAAAVYSYDGTITFNNCTIVDNVNSGPGGVLVNESGSFTFSNSILDNSPSANCSSGDVSLGYNIVSDASCLNINQSTDLVSTDPLLAEISNHDVGLDIYAFLLGSPAVDAGDDVTCETTDARGEARPADGDGDTVANCDIGAYESVCGDGSLSAAEECDDGNLANDDGCSSLCVVEVAPFCGDGMIQTGEVCDNGGGNSDTTSDACRTSCVEASCGDGVVDSGEGCDDGNSDSTDDCTNSCALASCGDGILQSGETCDDGDGNGDTTSDACRTTCVAASCGDGVVDTGEECDDDNSTNTDECTNSCTLAVCGDGIVQSGETCDDGDGNGDTTSDACRTTCVVASCGDGVVDTGEECDDGNLESEDGCSDICITEVSEEPSVCGDGVLASDEQCDDENTNNLDGCSSECNLEVFDDLTEYNTHLSFAELATGDEVLVSAPDPRSLTTLKKPSALVTVPEETCVCEWTLNPETFASMDTSAGCTIPMTIEGTDQAHLSVAVTCDGVTGLFQQTLVVSARAGEEEGSAASGQSGGGCQLNPDAQASAPMGLIWLALMLLGIKWKKHSQATRE